MNVGELCQAEPPIVAHTDPGFATPEEERVRALEVARRFSSIVNEPHDVK